MKCIILAAGYATRLYPLTENFPKPLLTVGDKTILDWLIDDIDGAHLVDEYIVVSNHKFASHFMSWAKEKTVKITVVDDGTSTNETRLGAVCDIQYAIDKLGIDDDLLVIAGDNLLDFSLQTFVHYAAQHQTSCIMRFFEPDDNRLHKCGVICIDDNDVVTNMEEKPAEPKSHWCCPPFYYYTRENAQWRELMNGSMPKATMDTAVAPLLTTRWNQSPIYNDMCPADNANSSGHAYAGCTAVATAQVMKYWNFPETGYGSHSYEHSTYGNLSADFGNTTYQWDSMNNTE